MISLKVFTSIVLFVFTCGASCERLWLTCDQIRMFVDGHNYRRHLVAQGIIPGQPAGADIKYMVWDEELAEKAGWWSENMIFGHNPDRTVWSRRWDLIGENVHINKLSAPWNTLIDVIPNIEAAIEDWFVEHWNYVFEPFHLGTKLPIGHYTQLVWANSIRVGCGISQIKRINYTETLFVCDYGPTGNYLNQLPYAVSDGAGRLSCPEGGCDRLYGLYC